MNPRAPHFAEAQARYLRHFEAAGIDPHRVALNDLERDGNEIHYTYVTLVNGTSLHRERRTLVLPAPRACAICGEPEGGGYAKPCCTPDQMIDV